MGRGACRRASVDPVVKMLALIAVLMLSAATTGATTVRSFSASNQNLRNTGAAAAPTPSLTLSVWVKTNWSSGDGGRHCILAWGGESVASRRIEFDKRTDDKVYISANDGSSSIWYTPGAPGSGFSDSGVFSSGSFTHFLITFDFTDGLEVIKVYKNGTELGHPTTKGGSGPVDTFSGFTIGNTPSLDTQANFDGDIAEVAAWDRIVSSGERASLAAGAPANCESLASGLVHYWKLAGSSPEPDLGSRNESLTVTNAGTASETLTLSCGGLAGRRSLWPSGARTGARQMQGGS